MKFNTQNAKIEAITDETMVVGTDIGSEMHYARAFTNRGIELSDKPFAFSNTEEGFLEFSVWMDDLMKKNGMKSVVTGMEPTGHYWFNLGAFLQDRGIRPLHVNPYHVKQSKEFDDNNPTKSDRKDPKVIAGLVNAGRYSYPYIESTILKNKFEKSLSSFSDDFMEEGRPEESSNKRRMKELNDPN